MVKIKTDFKLVPSKTLSYIIGVQYGDGSIYHYKPKNNFSIRLSTVDREFLEEWGKCCYAVLGKNGKVPINVLTTQYRDCYYSNVYSKKLFYFLSNSLDEHKRYIEVYPAEFVRGFFDSEGCVRNIAHKGLKISANNSNRKLINYIKELLYGLGIRNISFYLTKPGKKSYLYQKNRFIITKATMYEVSFTKYTDLKT